MNKFEQIKATKDGLDVWPDVEHYAEEGWEAISDDDKVRMKWYGVFFRKYTPGFFMMRIRIPNGIATAAQLRTIAGIAADFARGGLDITTRQQIQLRWFRIEQVPEILVRLRAVGLDTRQTGMDNVRNVIGCPLAGLTRDELFDASHAVKELNFSLVGNRAFTNLPRKFNIALSGCPDNCVHIESQDIGLVPAEKMTDAGSISSFNVLVGGKMGSGGFTPAQSIDAFVTPGEAAEVCCSIVELFRDHGGRESRSRARLAFLMEDWGPERFRSELEARLNRDLPAAGRDVRRSIHNDHLGVAPQRQPGKYTVGLAVPVGHLTSSQTVALAGLSERYGTGEVRLTPSQNLILTHVPDRQLPDLLSEPLLKELRPDPSAAMRGTVSCTGVGLCDLAMTDTKNDALDVVRRLDRSLSLQRPISIAWSGCPAGCGNHQLADIGLQGTKARVNGEVIPVYHILVGGIAARGAKAGTEVLSSIPAEEVGPIVERLVHAHQAGQDLVKAGLEIASEREASAAATPDTQVAA